MDKRTAVNVVAGPACGISLASIISKVIAAISAIEWLQGIPAVFEPFQTSVIQIEWPGVYIWIFGVSASVLLANNREWIVHVLHAMFRRRKPDMAVSSALTHVATTSYLSDSLSSNFHIRVRESAELLQSAIARGKIRMFGCAKGASIVEPIPESVWDTCEVLAAPNGEGGVTAWMVEKGKRSEPRFARLMVDSEDFYREFPPSPY